MKMGDEVEAGGVWCVAEALRHLISHCHIPSATLSIPHYYLSSLIPLHVHSLPPSLCSSLPPTELTTQDKKEEARGE